MAVTICISTNREKSFVKVINPFSIGITSPGKRRVGICGSSAFVCLYLHPLISVLFLFLLVPGVGSACDYGAPWMLLLFCVTCFLFYGYCKISMCCLSLKRRKVLTKL